MVRFTVLLRDQFDIEQILLKNESNLSGDAKVSRGDQHDFLQHCVLGQLVSILDVSVQLLLLHHVEVHDIANIQVEYPVLRVLDTESIPHI